jgi:hypothetical protein
MVDYTQMPDEEFWDEFSEITNEANRRRAIADAEEQQNALNKQTQWAAGIKEGDPWVQPTTAASAYFRDAIVTHNDKKWESLTPGNVWEPGVSGWREIALVPEWIQPTGAHDAYDAGDRVSHLGNEWISDVDANVWEPGVSGWIVAPA